MEDINSKLEKLYSVYGEEKVNEEIFNLEDRNKEVLLLFFGLAGRKKELAKNIAEKFQLSKISIYKIVNKELERIEKFLKYPNINKETFLNSKSDFLIKLYKKYPQEEILEKLKFLDEREREIFCSYYGINKYQHKSSSEIAELYGIKKENVSSEIRKLLNKMLNSASDENKVRKPYKNSRLDRMYKTYGESAVKLAIKDLRGRYRAITELYLGIDGEEPKSAKEISEIVGVGERSVNTVIWHTINKIEKLLENPNDKIILMEEIKKK